MNDAVLLLLALAAPPYVAAGDELVFHVAPGGDDAPDATRGPFATLERAQRAVRTALARGEERDIAVELGAGVYALRSPLVFGPADGGGAEQAVTWRARPGERVVVSGGQLLTSWDVAEDGTWSHAWPGANVRQLFVAGERRQRSRWPAPENEWLHVAAPGPDGRTSFAFEDGDLSAWPDVGGADLVFLHDWSMSRVGIAAIDQTEHTVRLAQPIGAWHPFFHITNFEEHPRYALENLRAAWDAPGEWVLDREAGRIHYRPVAGEEPASAGARVPVLERLMEVRGEPGKPVRGLHFEGITFSHTRAVDPPGGYAGIQAAFHEGRGEGIPPQQTVPAPSAVRVTHARDVTFTDCCFEQLGGAGLWLGEGSRGAAVRACTFADVGANGLMIGATTEPAEDADGALVSEIVCEDNTIERCGVLCPGAVGVWIGMAEKVTVRHNEVRWLPYTGISLGWIWNPRPSASRGHRIERNHIHHVMQVLSDGGGIYTLGRQPDTVLRHNLIHDVPLNLGRAESNGFFIDEGSTELVVEENVIHSIDRSPIRFHKAGTNTLRANVLVTPTDVSPFAYHNCSPDVMVFDDNRVHDAASWKTPTASDLDVGPRR